MNKVLKTLLSIVVAFLLCFGQIISTFAAIRNVTVTVVNSDSNSTTLNAVVTADHSSELQDGAASVSYSVYKGGVSVTGFTLPTMPMGPVTTVSNGVYERNYQFIINKSDYSSINNGDLFTVVKAVYNNFAYYSNSFPIFNSSENLITDFRIDGEVGSAFIDTSTHTITFYMPDGASVSALKPTIRVSTGAQIFPESGTLQDFTLPVKYTVTALDGSTQEWMVRCIRPVRGITLDKTSMLLAPGQSDFLRATISPDNATNKEYRWSSSDTRIATVSPSGEVTAVAKGTAVISVISSENPDVNAYCIVTVTGTQGTNTISGTVSLPLGRVAPTSGMDVSISLLELLPTTITTLTSTTVTIPAGSSSIPYTIKNIPNGSNYALTYSIRPESGYMPHAFYGTDGMRVGNVKSSLITLNNESKTNIDLQLLLSRKISGTISLPAGESAPEGDITIFYFADNSKDSVASMIKLAKGETSAVYSIEVPLYDDETNYRVRFLAINTAYEIQFGNNLLGAVSSSNSTASVDVGGGDCSEINATMIETRVITGTVSLLSGVAPAGGINVMVNAINGDYQKLISVIIPEGANSVEYVLSVPVSVIPVMDVDIYAITNNDTPSIEDDFYSATSTKLPIPGAMGSSDYQISCSVVPRSENTPTDYYYTSVTAHSPTVNVASGNTSSINLTILSGERSIKGTVMLPDNRVAPEGGVGMRIYAHNSSLGNSPYTDVYIPVGEKSTAYEIKVPANSGYTLEYLLRKDSYYDYMTNGFYVSNGIVGGPDAAAQLDVTTVDVTNRNLVLVAGKVIQGTISMPANYENLKHNGIWMRVYASNGTNFSMTDAVIEKGASSVTYSLFVPAGSGYKIWYTQYSVDEFAGTAFYNSNNTTVYAANANLVTVSDAGVTGINMSLIATSRTISGSVSLPGGSSRSQYLLQIIPGYGSGYEVKYVIKSGNSDNKYAERGFYSFSGTSANPADINAINVSVSSKAAINLVLVTGVSEISLNNTALNLKVNESASLMAVVKPENASNKKVLWSSSNTTVAEVDSSGRVTAKSVGTAAITAASESNPSVKVICTVTVTSTAVTAPGGGGGFIMVPPMDTPDTQTVDQAVKAIKEITSTPSASNDSKTTNDKILEAINTAISKLATKHVTPGISGDNIATAIIDYKTMNDIVDNAGKVVKTVESISDKLDNPSVEARMDKKVIIDVSVEPAIKKVDIKVPCDLLKKVGEKGVEKVDIVLPTAIITVSPDFVKMNSKTAVFSVNRTNENNQTAVELELKMTDENGLSKTISDFDKDVMVSVPYALKDGEDKENITVFYIAPDGSKSNMSGKYVNGNVMFRTGHFSKYVIASNIVTFNDTAKHWSEKYVAAMASKGFVSGKGNELFDPDGEITRAEFLKLITCLMGVVDETATAKFSDVSSSDWYYTYVASATKAGIIDESEKFGPNVSISREDMTVIISKALTTIYKEKAPSNVDAILTRFEDQDIMIGDVRSAIATCVQYGIMSGKGVVFDPEGTATRGEAAKILYQLFNY